MGSAPPFSLPRPVGAAKHRTESRHLYRFTEVFTNCLHNANTSLGTARPNDSSKDLRVLLLCLESWRQKEEWHAETRTM